MRSGRFIFIGIFLLILILLATIYSCTLIQFEVLKDFINANAADGDVKTFSREFHANIIRRAYQACILLSLTTLLLIFLRKKLISRLQVLSEQKAELYSDIKYYLKKVYCELSLTELVFFLGILFTGIFLRLVRIDIPVTYDEAFNFIYYSIKPVSIIISDYSYPNNQIFHTLLIKASTSIFGVGHVSLRIPALLAGILIIPLSYLVCRQFTSIRSALFGAVLFATLPGFVWYSALARGYSIITLLFLLMILSGVHFLRKKNHFSLVIASSLAALGLYTIPIMLYPTLGFFLWISISKLKDSTILNSFGLSIKYGFLTLIIALILYSPVILTHGLSKLFYHPTMGPNSWEYFVTNISNKLSDLYRFWLEPYGHTVYVILLLFLTGVVRSSKLRALMISIFLILTPLILIQKVIAPDRSWAWLLVPIGLSIGAGFDSFANLFKLNNTLQKMITGFVITGALTTLTIFCYRYQKKNYMHYIEAESVVEKLNQPMYRDCKIVVQFPFEAPIQYYMYEKNLDFTRVNNSRSATCVISINTDKLSGESTSRSLEQEFVKNSPLEFRSDTIIKSTIVKVYSE